jgi:hypothetical protein
MDIRSLKLHGDYSADVFALSKTLNLGESEFRHTSDPSPPASARSSSFEQELTRGPKTTTKSQRRGKARFPGAEMSIDDLRSINRLDKMLRRDSRQDSNEKLLMSEFARRLIDEPMTRTAPLQDLIDLNDTLDKTLSTSEYLSILRRIGVKYTPRTRQEKKNIVAEDFSLFLAPNGVRLSSDGTPT